jgi:AcrR family transcriptional regulator
VTPRPYRMQARQASAEETRARIVDAARALLSAPRGIEAFTIDSVARKAGVSRMTVYHQFGSKTGLIEAVFDSLAIVRSGVPRLVAALGLADPHETLATFVHVFAEVWQADRVVIRRLQGLAALDSEFARVWHTREERRREGLRMIVARLSAQRAGTSRVRADAVSPDQAMLTDVLYAIIAFETYDVIAGPKRRFERIVPIIHRLAFMTLGLGAPPTTGRARRRGVSR